MNPSSYEPPENLPQYERRLWQRLVRLTPKLLECQNLADEHLAGIISKELQFGRLTQATREILFGWFRSIVSSGRVPRWLWPTWSLLRSTLRVSLLEEGKRRIIERNRPTGWVVIEFVKKADDETRMKLLDRVTKGLSHPEFSFGSPEGRAEVASMASEGLVARINAVLRSTDPYQNHLLVAIQGEYQRHAECVRHSISDTLQNLYHRSKDFQFVPVEQSRDQKLVHDGHTEIETRLLVEECLTHPALSRDERVLLQMSFQGYTQLEMAKQFRISQPAVAQRLRKIRPKLSK